MNFKPKALVYPAREKVTLTLNPVFPVTIDAKNDYALALYPFSGLKCYALRDRQDGPGKDEAEFFSHAHKMQFSENSLTLELSFPQEDCYICFLHVNGQRVDRFELYALDGDLFERAPYRGDNHMHTYMSDGKESPAYMAAAACKNGNDYCVITDHHEYEPSLIAKRFFEATGVDFLVIPGEEVHSPDNPVHIINLGGTESVNAWWKTDDTDYRNAVAREMELVPECMTDANRFSAAACQAVFEKIKSVDGVSVLCHPNWIVGLGFNESEDVTEYLFDNRRFDALELIAGGAFEAGTQMQISFYHDRPEMPILGSSDTHGCFNDELEPGNYTIVFAKEYTVDGIKDAIRNKYTVAGNQNKLYGSYRLVKFAYFLRRNFYSEHTLARKRLGSEMLRVASACDNTSGRAQRLKETRPSELFGKIKY